MTLSAVRTEWRNKICELPIQKESLSIALLFSLRWVRIALLDPARLISTLPVQDGKGEKIKRKKEQ